MNKKDQHALKKEAYLEAFTYNQNIWASAIEGNPLKLKLKLEPKK